jgi:hypothetical protein
MASDVHQDALAAAVAEVLARLDAHAAGPGHAAPAADPPPGSSALDVACACFGLTTFERYVLVLAAAEEVDPTAGTRCAAACGDPRRPYPTFSLAFAALPDPHWSALAPVSPLRRWGLVELEPDGAVTTARLRIDERILHFLAGVPYLDVRLHGLVRPVDPPTDLPPSHQRVAQALAECWTAGPTGAPHATLAGADTETRREIAAVAARQAGMRLLVARSTDLPVDPVARDALARLWEREAILLPAALLVEIDDAGPERCEAIAGFCASLAVPAAVSGADPVPAAASLGRRLAVSPLDAGEQRGLWSTVLDGAVPVSGGDLSRLVAQFTLPGHAIRAAADTVRRRVAGNGVSPDDGYRWAWQAGLDHARLALDDLGRRMEPRARRGDLVLPASQRTVLDEIVAHVRQRATVYEDWGFDAMLRRGLGVTALFAGGSGTGKTLAAEVIAGALGLDLFVIDLSQVINKYIGETEKNLRRVFDAAERGGAVLLFDEADALFGRRSEVRDSHDRYANIEVSYLLMCMEAYRGLAILTTNMKKALDPAFLRRLRFVVDFPFPEAAERAEIWRRVIPDRTPVRALDTGRLAQLTVTGGSIRNIALSAAFLAADEGEPLQMRHVLAASQTEYLKLERSLTPAEVAGWL